MLLNRAPFLAVRRGNPPPHKVLNHGDLAGTSVLWSGGAVVGVLDWDLASRDNPAGGIASLADWQGWQAASHLAYKPTVNPPTEELERTIERAGGRIRRRSVCIDW